MTSSSCPLLTLLHHSGGGRVDLKKQADSNSADDKSTDYEVGENAIAQGRGSVTRKTHQDENSTEVQSLKKGLKLGSYVGIIAGTLSMPPAHVVLPLTFAAGNQLSGFKDQPARYNVLDFFHVTDVWCEKAAFKKFSDKPETKICREWCVRLEKVSLDTVSWWDNNPANYAPLDQVCGELCAKITCDICNTQSKRIYNEGWTCLNHDCKMHFLDHEGNRISKGTYNQQFLAERTPVDPSKKSAEDPSSVFHEVTQTTAEAHGTETWLRGGVICEKCGCCSRRIYWSRHACESPGCDWTQPVQVKVYPLEDLAEENETFAARVAKSKAATDKRFLAQDMEVNPFAVDLDIKIRHRVGSIGPYVFAQFLLPSPTGQIIGSVSIFRASDDIRANGVDELFDNLSVQDIGLKRNVVSCGGSK